MLNVFFSHVGYLGGAEAYAYGNGDRDPTKGKHDMWHNSGPGIDIVPQMYYSANFYTDTAVKIIEDHDLSRPLWLHFPIQNVHSPYTAPPEWECQATWPGISNETWPTTDHTYANMLHMLDNAVLNVTTALRQRVGMWENTLLVFSAGIVSERVSERVRGC